MGNYERVRKTMFIGVKRGLRVLLEVADCRSIDMLNYNIGSVSDWYNRTMVKYKQTSGDAKIRNIHLLSGWLPSLKQT